MYICVNRRVTRCLVQAHLIHPLPTITNKPPPPLFLSILPLLYSIVSFGTCELLWTR